MASQAIARASAGGELAKLETQLETRAGEFKKALPSHITPDKFQRTVMTAVQSDPDLLLADRRSLVTACMKAAQDGLLPDKREAALVIFSNRVKDGQGKWISVKEVQYMPMVYGLRKKIIQSGEVKDIFTAVVYRAEIAGGYFVYEEGTERMLRHKPMLDLTDEESSDENIIAAYSIATLTDGSHSFEVMRRSEINKIRQRSQTGALGKTKYNSNEVIPPKGPWVDWFSEMAKKSVMRRHSKTLPMSGDIFLDVEEQDEEIAARSTQAVLASTAALPPTRLEHADAETGEILDEREIAEQLDRETYREMDGETETQPPADEGTDAVATSGLDADQNGAVDQKKKAGDTLPQALARVRAGKIPGDVNALVKSFEGQFDEDEMNEIRSEAMDRIAYLKGGN